MKRSMCGLALLAAATGLWSCYGDPTDSFRDEQRIIATPSSVFVEQGLSEFVLVELVDDQGNQLAGDFTATAAPGITVERDEGFVPTTAGQLPTRTRFIVTGVDATVSSFDVSAGGVTTTVPVRVVPAGAGIPPATVASTGPNATDPTVLTVPAPFAFFPGSGVTFDAGQGIVIDRSADGRSITVLPAPGTTSTGTATVFADYLPTVPLETTTDVPLTISATVPAMSGTGDPATAPPITIPPIGGSSGFFDAGTYGATTCGDNTGAPCQLYSFTLAEETTFDVNAFWSNSADVGVYFTTPDGLTETGQACDEHGNGAEAQPEHCLITLAAGSYLMSLVSYGPFYDPADPNPEWLGVQFITPEPEATE